MLLVGSGRHSKYKFGTHSLQVILHVVAVQPYIVVIGNPRWCYDGDVMLESTLHFTSASAHVEAMTAHLILWSSMVNCNQMGHFVGESAYRTCAKLQGLFEKSWLYRLLAMTSHFT